MTLATAELLPFKFYFITERTEEMNKKRAIEIIFQAAAIYQNVFSEKNFLIIYGKEAKPEFIETKSLPRNFLHLTGMKLNESIPGNTAERFLEKALTHKLSENDFEFKDGSTEQKLKVLIQTLNIKSNARMIGDFSGNRVNLKTDKVAGGTNSFLGFLKVGESYVPNTVMEGDIRKDMYFPSRVLGVLSKRIHEQTYNERIYFAKKIDVDKLIQKMRNDIPVAEELIFTLSSTPFNGSVIQVTQTTEIKQANQTNNFEEERILLQKEAAVKMCDEILKANPDLKAKLNFAAAEYCSKHNLPPFDSSLSTDKRYEMRNKVLKENPKLMDEYVKVKKEYEEKQLVVSAARSTKSFAQGLDEFAKRPKEQSTQKLPEHNNSDHKHRK